MEEGEKGVTGKARGETRTKGECGRIRGIRIRLDEVVGPRCVKQSSGFRCGIGSSARIDSMCSAESEAARNLTHHPSFRSHVIRSKSTLPGPNSSHPASSRPLTQHPPIKLANSLLASSPLIPISSISSKFFLPQKSFTPLTSRLLIFSTSGSSTAAKQILK